MRWKPGGRSGDLSDQRGRRGGRAALPVGGGLVGVIVVVLITLLGGGGGGGGTGVSLPDILEQLPSAQEPQGGGESVPGAPEEERTVQFVSFVLDDVQNFWAEQFRRGGSEYPRAKLVLFRAGVDTGCGSASSASGPFYCPADRYVYIDLGFFDQLESFGGSSGPLAQSYVLAHEYGHHVQNLTGVLQRANNRDTGPQGDAVRVELQADCYAGAWVANALRTGLVEDIPPADIQDALTSAAAIGDDRIQEKTQGQVNPETWTHGSSDQRQSWFVRGIEGGTPNSCDTFRGRV